MEALTDFADLAVVVPLTLVLALVLGASGWGRGAMAWAVVVMTTLALTAVAKVLVYAYGTTPFLDELQSASGHTAAGTVVYGGLLVLLLPRSAARAVALPVAALAAGLFGATRLALEVHTVTDVLAGAGLGIAGVLLLAWTVGPRPSGLPRLRLLLAALVVTFALHGQQLRAEGLLLAIGETIEARR